MVIVMTKSKKINKAEHMFLKAFLKKEKILKKLRLDQAGQSLTGGTKKGAGAAAAGGRSGMVGHLIG